MDQALNALRRELGTLRTGRVTTALVSTLRVEAWGTRMPMEQVAQITVQQPRGLVVTPHDPSLVPDVEKTLVAAELGCSPRIDGGRLRLEIPAPTEERRIELKKQARDLAEQARVAMRLARRDAVNELKRRRAAEEISEGKLHGRSKDLQELTDEHVAEVEKALRDALAAIDE
jgi:ribosome recycling factor